MTRRRTSLGSLGVTPSTDTSSPPAPTTVNRPLTVAAVATVVIGLGVLWWFNEKDD